MRLRAQAIFETALAIIGGVVTIAEFAALFGIVGLPQLDWRGLVIGLAIAALISAAINRDRLEERVPIADSPDVAITLKVCDVLRNEGAVIIPTNTTFDTVMEDDFISPRSVQGQYQLRYFYGQKARLDSMMVEALAGKRFTQLNDGRGTKACRYPIGTVCKLSEAGKRAYFLADSDVNKNGIAMGVDAGQVSKALVSLWDELAEIGDKEQYSIPLIGTGRAGACNLSRDEAVELTILSFLAATKERKITESLVICISPSDFGKVNWDKLCEFLRYQCKYKNRKPAAAVPSGSANHEGREVTWSQLATSDVSGSHDSDAHILPGKEEALLLLLRGNRLTLHEIAEAEAIATRSAHELVRRLLEKGLIRCEGDGRARVYSAVED